MSNPNINLEITERDEAGAVTVTYIHSTRKHGTSEVSKQTFARIDVIPPPDGKPLLQRVLDVFLPTGYPQSVTEDYLWYQIYDSLQAFSSSIAGLLCSRAVLEGVGVGDATTTPTSALLLTILQETLSRLATIAFAARLGPSFSPECKRYRLLADIFNDAAMLLECLCPLLPTRSLRVAVLCSASMGKALCGVAAGSAKASLSAHFARRDNLGELGAKDASQETVISLMGMLAGSVIVPRLVSTGAIWSMLVVLLAVHLGTNWLAVRAVSMQSLNRQRANILLSTLLESGTVLTPAQVAKREKVFERDGVLRWHTGQILGYCRIGVTLEELLVHAEGRSSTQRSFPDMQLDLKDFLDLFSLRQYLLWFDKSTRQAFIVLKKDASPTDQLQAWMHALVVAYEHGRADYNLKSPTHMGTRYAASDYPDQDHGLLDWAITHTFQLSAQWEKELKTAGWDLSIAAMETRPGTRISGVDGDEDDDDNDDDDGR